MKRKQVVASFLALAMVAGSVANTAPMSVLAAPIVKGNVGTVQGSTVTLKADVTSGSTITIPAEDLRENKTVTIQADGETYTKILKSPDVPEGTNAFSSAEDSVALKESDFSSSAVQDLYLLKKNAEDITTEGNMIRVKAGYLRQVQSMVLSAGALTSETSVLGPEGAEILLGTKSVNLMLTTIGDKHGKLDYQLSTTGTASESWTGYNVDVQDKYKAITLEEGDNYIHAKCENDAGVTTAASVKIVVDTTAPTVRKIEVAGKDVTSSETTIGDTSATLSITAEDAKAGLDKIYYAVGAESKNEGELASVSDYAEATGNQATLTLSTGDNYIYVKAVDKVGNASYICSGKITVDTTDPDFSFVASEATTLDEASKKYDITSAGLRIDFTPSEGDSVVAVTKGGVTDSEAVSNKYATINTVGPTTLAVAVKHNANGKMKTKEIPVTCYKKVDATASDAVSKTYGAPLSASELYTNNDSATYQGTPTIKCIANDAESVSDPTAFANGTSSLPKDAGTYWVMTTFPANGYYLANSVFTKVTINKKADEPVTYNGTVTVQGTDTTTGVAIDLKSTVEKFISDGETLAYAEPIVSNSKVTATKAGSVITIKGAGNVEADQNDSVTVVVTGFKNYVQVTVTIPVKVTKNAVMDLQILGAEDKPYDGVAETITSNVAGATITITGADTSEVKKAGTYTITASSTSAVATGYASKTITISKRPIQVKLADTIVTAGTDPASVTYPTSVTAENLVSGHRITAAEFTLTSDYTADAAAGATFVYKNLPSTENIKVYAGEDEVTANYEMTFSEGCVKVQGSSSSGNNQPSGGGSPITGGGSDPAPSTPAPTTPSTDKPADTKPADKPVDTTTAKVETNAAGETVITNEAGEAIKNDIVKVDGAKYITDESGVVIKDSFATTPSGNKVFADESGKVITDKTFKVDGVKYVASKSGAIVTDSFATTDSGNKVFCDETGAVVTNTTVVVDGEKYFAKASGAIATKQFVKTPSGNKVYCSKDGSIITNKAFKVGGKQYVATKSGKIVTGKWVTVGSKKYYCNKNGVVTKTKKVSKK